MCKQVIYHKDTRVSTVFKGNTNPVGKHLELWNFTLLREWAGYISRGSHPIRPLSPGLKNTQLHHYEIRMQQDVVDKNVFCIETDIYKS